MITTVAFLALYCAQGGDLSLDERGPAAVLIILDQKSPPKIRRAQIMTALDRALREISSLYLQSETQSGLTEEAISQCAVASSLTCWTRILRGGDPIAWTHPSWIGEHLSEEQGKARLFFVVSSFGSWGDDQRDHLDTLLIDTNEVIQIAKDAVGRGASSEQIEDLVFARALGATSSKVAISEDRLQGYFSELLRNRFASILARSKFARRLGGLAIEQASPGLEIILDGRGVGRTVDRQTRISGVAPGRRRLQIREGARELFRTEVEVRSDETATVAALAMATGDSRSEQLPFQIGGGALALAGIGILAYAMIADSNVEAGFDCIGSECMRSTSSFARWCDYGDVDPDNTCSGLGKMYTAPLGIGLGVAGAVVLLGSQLAADDEKPWLATLLGIGGGIVAYGLASTLGSADRFGAR